jgi:nucleotide-binding universal stress UspA family protein
MYKQIATDGSELANRALAHGLKLANEVKARVTIVTVTPQKPPIASWSDVSPRPPEQAKNMADNSRATKGGQMIRYRP